MVPMPGRRDRPGAAGADRGCRSADRPLERSGRSRHAAGAGTRCHCRAGFSFDPRHFISGARSAYEMIVLAFANGDRRALKDLLSSEVYESFETVIKDREKHEQKTETRFVSIDKAELVGAEARDRAAQLTVRFVSQMISVTRDKAGTDRRRQSRIRSPILPMFGHFARDTTSRDPNWKLVGTGSAH